MKNNIYYISISLVLIFLSTVMFFIHYLIFGQPKDIISSISINLCFLPINSFVVTMFLDKLIDYKVEKERIENLNLLSGIFFTEMGNKLMNLMIKADKNSINLITSFEDLEEVENAIKNHIYHINIDKIDLDEFMKILLKNRNLLVSLISNQNIQQYEIFTDTLMSVIHLRDEIIFYKNNKGDNNKDIDLQHIEKDILRVYENITLQWVDYLKYLEKDYPYFYKNVLRVNPFKFN